MTGEQTQKDHGTTDRVTVCPHGHDRRVMWCIWCEDPARMTGAAHAGQAPVMTTINQAGASPDNGLGFKAPVAGGSLPNRPAEYPQLSHPVSMLDAPAKYDSIQASIWAFGYNMGYADATNELRPEGAATGAATAGSAGETGAEGAEKSRHGEAQGRAPAQEQGAGETQDRRHEGEAPQVSGSSAKILDGRQ